VCSGWLRARWGVANLRGLIVPILDLRIKFALGEPTYDQFTVVVVLNVGDSLVGMVVDSVSDVITLTPDQLKPVPAMAALIESDYLVGMGAIDERTIILMDIDKLLASDDIGLIATMAA
jgi:purine-binding chemotaxis protein CheW